MSSTLCIQLSPVAATNSPVAPTKGSSTVGMASLHLPEQERRSACITLDNCWALVVAAAAQPNLCDPCLNANGLQLGDRAGACKHPHRDAHHNMLPAAVHSAAHQLQVLQHSCQRQQGKWRLLYGMCMTSCPGRYGSSPLKDAHEPV